MHLQNPPPSVQTLLTRIRNLAHPPARRSERTFWVEGLRNFIHAHDAHYPFDTIVFSPILLKSSTTDMLARRLASTGVPRIKLTPEQFRSISLAEHASGIGAILKQRWTPLHHPPESPRPGLCHLILEYIRSPGNLGTILRTAEATGVAGIIFLNPHHDPFDPATVRASMAGLFRLPLIRATYGELHHWSRTHQIPLVALSPDAPRTWTDLPPHRPGQLAIVLGEERQGLSPTLRKLCRHSVSLPMTGRADSLNVSIAAGIMLYELIRRNNL